MMWRVRYPLDLNITQDSHLMIYIELYLRSFTMALPPHMWVPSVTLHFLSQLNSCQHWKSYGTHGQIRIFNIYIKVINDHSPPPKRLIFLQEISPTKSRKIFFAVLILWSVTSICLGLDYIVDLMEVLSKSSAHLLFSDFTWASWHLGHRLISIGIPIINLRRSSDHLRFIIGIPIPVRRRLLIE